MYEPRGQPPIAPHHFARRLARHTGIAVGVMALSLFLGMAGYRYLEGLSWRDAFLNAAMLLGGEGPVEVPRTDGGKLFAGLYALYSGLVFLVVVALILAPLVHRLLHKFHWDEE